MTITTLPFAQELLREIADTHGTPVFVYDEAGIRRTARAIQKAFDWSQDYTNYFAVKATPTPAILRILAEEGMGFDCSSKTELLLVQQSVAQPKIFFTSNNTSDEEYQLANELGAIINIDKFQDLAQVERVLGKLPDKMSVRYNPGKQAAGNLILGDPVASKFGDTEEHVVSAVQQMHEKGVKSIGIHAMLASNETQTASFERTAQLLKQLVEAIGAKTNATISFINAGGGLGINYDKSQPLPDVAHVGEVMKQALSELTIPILTEFGRYVTGPHGFLLTKVTHGFVESYETYLQVDTSINNFPGYASDTTDLHHIEVTGKTSGATRQATVVGSMCVNSDKMFKNRQLPSDTQPGDLLIVFDAGAHARAKAHNYNLRPRAGEVLVHEDNRITLIRRHETEDDILATVKEL